eukprot:1189958-Prorocentrum_minimum.AAC.1
MPESGFSDVYISGKRLNVLAMTCVWCHAGDCFDLSIVLTSLTVPLTVLAMTCVCCQAGDCFDLSIVLTSLLCGVGYDAYAVMGYAPKAVTMADQELLQCPLLEEEEAARIAEANRPKKKEVRKRKRTKRGGTNKKKRELKTKKTSDGDALNAVAVRLRWPLAYFVTRWEARDGHVGGSVSVIVIT